MNNMVVNLVWKRLKEDLALWKQLMGGNGKTDPLKSFIFKYGQSFHPRAFTGKRGECKQCFRNALHYALEHELYYCEGYAISGNLKSLPIIMEHAWACDNDNNVYDPTWENPEDSVYYGIRFDRHEAAERCFDKETYGMFFDGNCAGMYDRDFIKVLEKTKSA